MAQIIKDNFDLLAVVEVMQKQGGHPGYDQLMQALGGDWGGLVTDSPRPNTSAGHAEYYAVIYRKDDVSPCSGWTDLRYHQDNDGTENEPDLFSREPAYACFEVMSEASTVGCDFMLAVYHATWADGDEDDIRAEVSHLPEVFQAMTAERPGEKDLFVAGDFNLTPDVLAITVSAHDQTVGSGSTLNSLGKHTSNLYDHVLLHDPAATTEMTGDAAVLDVMNRAASAKGFYKTVSDHLPIVGRLSCAGPDDD